MKSTQATQTTCDTTTLDASTLTLFTSIKDELQALKEELLEHHSQTWQHILQQTFTLFQELRYLTPTTVSLELMLCADISALCAEPIHQKPKHLPCHTLYQRIMRMHEHYLRHHPENNREQLIRYNAIIEQYKQRLGLTTSETLSSILGDTFDSIVPIETRTTSTQTDLTAATPKPVYQALTRDIPEAITYADLHERLTELQNNPLPRKTSKAVKAARKQQFDALHHDMHAHIQKVKLVAHNMPDFELSLTIQAAYIDHIRPLNNPYQLDRALQRAAHLFRLFNTMYQKTDASAYLKAEFAKSAAFMQEQALNIKQGLACGLIMDSHDTTEDEKQCAQLQAAYYQDRTASALLTICAHYHSVLDPNNEYVAPPEHVETDLPYELDECHTALEHDLRVPQSEYMAYHKTRAYLNHALNILLPQPEYCQTYFQYVDNNYEYSQETDDAQLAPQLIAEFFQHPVKQQHLARAISLYYEVREKHLNSIKPNAYADVNNAYFILKCRVDAYAYLLKDSHDTLDEQHDTYQQFVLTDDRSTPLIRALARHKLNGVTQKIAQMQAQAIPVAPSKATPPQTQKASPQKPKKQAKPKAAATKTTVWDLIAHQFHDITAPGWRECKQKINACLKAREPLEAQKLVDAWLLDAPHNQGANHLLHHNSLFDAHIFKAIIFKHQKHYDEALAYIEEAKQHLAPKTHATTQNHQTQKIMCEQAAIYQAQAIENHDHALLERAAVELVQAKVKAREIGSFCFTALWNDIKNLPAVFIDTYPDEQAYFFNNQTPLMVDSDNEPFFYDFYEKIAVSHMYRGLEALKQFKVGQDLGRIPQGALEPTTDLNLALEMYNRLINYSSSRSPEKNLDFHHKVATLYQCMQALSSKNKYLKEASAHHTNALSLARQLGDNKKVASITEHRGLTVTLSGLKGRVTTSAIQHENRRARYQDPTQKYHEFMGSLTEENCNYTTQYKNMTDAIQLHLICTHLRTALWLLEQCNPQHLYVQDDSPQVRGQKVDLNNALLHEKTTLLATIAGSTSTAISLIKDAYLNALKNKTCPIDVLLLWHELELHYLAYMKHCEEAERAERLIGTSTPTPDDNQDLVNEQKIQITKIEKLIKKHGGTPKTYVLSDIMKQHRTPLDLYLDPRLLSTFASMTNMPESFARARDLIQQKQIWQALEALFICLKNPLTKEQTKPIYCLIAYTVQWLYSALNSPEFTARITHHGHQDIVGVISAQLQGQYKAYFGKANQGRFITSMQPKPASLLQLEAMQHETKQASEKASHTHEFSGL